MTKKKKPQYELIDIEYENNLGKYFGVRDAQNRLRNSFGKPMRPFKLPSGDYRLCTDETFGGAGFLLRKSRRRY